MGTEAIVPAAHIKPVLTQLFFIHFNSIIHGCVASTAIFCIYLCKMHILREPLFQNMQKVPRETFEITHCAWRVLEWCLQALQLVFKRKMKCILDSVTSRLYCTHKSMILFPGIIMSRVSSSFNLHQFVNCVFWYTSTVTWRFFNEHRRWPTKKHTRKWAWAHHDYIFIEIRAKLLT